MSAILNKLVNDDFIWDVLVVNLPRYKRSNTQFYNFNCPICLDYKPRAGIKRSQYIGISCFNCGFATRYKVGDLLSGKMRMFLERIGVADLEIKRLNLRALAIKRALEDAPALPATVEAITFEPNFPVRALPDESRTLLEWADLGCTDPDYLAAVEYAMSRGDVVMEHADFHWSPDAKFADRLIVPFRWRGRIVGYTARAVDPNEKDKYLNTMPDNFLFNSGVLDGDRSFALIVEGPLDALAIDGVSPMGSRLNEKQVVWLRNSGKQIIVVPDRDEKGQKMIDLARRHNFSVAFPGLNNANSWWDHDIKDCDDAVKRHGRLYTLRSIIETSTNNATEIEVKRKYLV